MEQTKGTKLGMGILLGLDSFQIGSKNERLFSASRNYSDGWDLPPKIKKN